MEYVVNDGVMTKNRENNGCLGTPVLDVRMLIVALSQMEHFVCTCGYGLTMAAACACPLSPRESSVAHSSLYRSEGCSLALWPLRALDTHFCRVRSPHWGELRNRLLVKAALRHESADSEEDREGLGCHLGQGHKMRLASDAQPETILTF